MQDQRRPRTSLNVTASETETLRDVAAALGYFTTRGPNAGRQGNVTALMAAIAHAADRNHAFVVSTLRGLVATDAHD